MRDAGKKAHTSVRAVYLDFLKIAHKVLDKIVKVAYSKLGKHVSEGQVVT